MGTFVGTPMNLPEHVIILGTQSFVMAAEEKRPSSSDDWLAVVIAALQAVESVGFAEAGEMEHMAPIALAFLRSLLKARAVGSTDGGEGLVPDRAHLISFRGRRVAAKSEVVRKCTALRWRACAELYEECCYCGRYLDPAELEGPEKAHPHEKVCPMSPDRCGRRLTKADGSCCFEMFHGTNEKCASLIEKEGFKPSVSGMLGPGIYCSRELRKARRYGSVVFLLHVRLGRVIKIDRKEHPLRTTWQTAIGGLYDCAWVLPNCGVVPSGLEENCVRCPSQVRVVRRVDWLQTAVS